jgi:hypothetical protein
VFQLGVVTFSNLARFKSVKELVFFFSLVHFAVDRFLNVLELYGVFTGTSWYGDATVVFLLFSSTLIPNLYVTSRLYKNVEIMVMSEMCAFLYFKYF